MSTSAFGVDHGFSKSFSGGVYKPILRMTAKERGAISKPKKGVSAADKGFKEMGKVRRTGLSGPHSSGSYNGITVESGAPGGATTRLGSKSGGKSYVAGSGRTGKEADKILAHESQHARPKRSEYRVHQQISGSPTKTLKEEARADYMTQGHSSGVSLARSNPAQLHARSTSAKEGTGIKAKLARKISPPKYDSQGTNPRAYSDLQNRMRAKGIKPKGSK